MIQSQEFPVTKPIFPVNPIACLIVLIIPRLTVQLFGDYQQNAGMLATHIRNTLLVTKHCVIKIKLI